MHIRIVKIGAYTKRPGEQVFIVDRRSVLGNPYYLKNRDSACERAYVCDLYQERFDKIVNPKISQEALDEYYAQHIDRAAFTAALERIVEAAKHNYVALACWCVSPYEYVRCHAETIVTYVEGRLEEDANERS